MRWVVLATGLAVLAGGGVFGYLSKDHHEDAVGAMSALSAESLQKSAQSEATTANVMFGVGGAITLVGTVWVVVW